MRIVVYGPQRRVGALTENGVVLLEALLRARPKTLKGVMIKSIHISSTMGPGLKLDISKFLKETESTD